jgi:hypothetical protein
MTSTLEAVAPRSTPSTPQEHGSERGPWPAGPLRLNAAGTMVNGGAILIALVRCAWGYGPVGESGA